MDNRFYNGFLIIFYYYRVYFIFRNNIVIIVLYSLFICINFILEGGGILS